MVIPIGPNEEKKVGIGPNPSIRQLTPSDEIGGKKPLTDQFKTDPRTIASRLDGTPVTADLVQQIPQRFLQLFPNKEIAERYYQVYLRSNNKVDFEYFRSSLNQLNTIINEAKKLESNPRKKAELERAFYTGAGLLINGNNNGFVDLLRSLEIKKQEGMLTRAFQDSMQTVSRTNDERYRTELINRAYDMQEQFFKLQQKELQRLSNGEESGEIKAYLTGASTNLKLTELNRKYKIFEAELEVQDAFKKIQGNNNPTSDREIYRHLELQSSLVDKVISLVEKRGGLYLELAKNLTGEAKEAIEDKIKAFDDQLKNCKEQKEELTNAQTITGAKLYVAGYTRYRQDYVNFNLNPILKGQEDTDTKNKVENPQTRTRTTQEQIKQDTQEKIQEVENIRKRFNEKVNFSRGQNQQLYDSAIEHIHAVAQVKSETNGQIYERNRDAIVSPLKKAILLEQNIDGYLTGNRTDVSKDENGGHKIQTTILPIVKNPDHYLKYYTGDYKHVEEFSRRFANSRYCNQDFTNELNPTFKKAQEELQEVINGYKPTFYNLNERAVRIGHRLQPLVLLIRDTQRFEELEQKKQKEKLTTDEERELREITKRGILTDRGLPKEKLEELQKTFNDPGLKEDLDVLMKTLPRLVNNLSVANENSELGKELVQWRNRLSELNKYFGPQGEFSTAIIALRDFDPDTFPANAKHFLRTSGVIILSAVTCSLLAASVVGAPAAGAGFLEIAAFTAESFAIRGIGMTIGSELGKEAVAAYEPGFKGSRFLTELRQGNVSSEAWKEVSKDTARNIALMATFSALGKTGGHLIGKGATSNSQTLNSLQIVRACRGVQRAHAFSERILGGGGSEAFTRQLVSETIQEYGEEGWEQGWESFFASSEVKFSDNPTVDNAIKVSIGSLASLWSSLGVNVDANVKERLILDYGLKFNESKKRLEAAAFTPDGKISLEEFLTNNGFVIGKVSDTTIEAMLGGESITIDLVKDEGEKASQEKDTVDKRLARTRANLNKALEQARVNNQTDEVTRLTSLLEKLNQVEASCTTVDGVLAHLAASDHPVGFLNEAREEIASLLNVPKDRIFFIDDSDTLSWGHTNPSMINNPPSGSHSEIQDNTKSERVTLINNGIGDKGYFSELSKEEQDFILLQRTVHEAVHLQISNEARQKINENPVSVIIKEGYQHFEEQRIILELANRGTEFSPKVKEIIEKAYEATIIERMGFTRVSPYTTFEEKVNFLVTSPFLEVNREERLFVDNLISLTSKEAIRKAFNEGDVTELRSQVGAEKFDALQGFLGKWLDTSSLSNRRHSNTLAFNIASQNILNNTGDLSLCSQRLNEFTAELDECLKREGIENLDNTLSTLGRQLKPAIQLLSQYASDYVNSGDKTTLTQNLNDLVNKLKPETSQTQNINSTGQSIPSTPNPSTTGIGGHFDPGSISLFGSCLSNYSYGKNLNLLLDPARNFEVGYESGDKPCVLLKNFFHPHSYQGVCGEVAHSYGMDILDKPEIKDRYDVVIVAGSVKDIFSGGHAFLLIAPKELDIREVLNRDKTKFPEGSLLVDPSLGVVEDASKFNERGGKYKLDGVVPYEEVQFSGTDVRLELEPNDSNPVVIGFLQDYIPVDDPRHDNRMLYLTFNTDSDSKITSVGLMAHDPKTDKKELIDLNDYPYTSNQVQNLTKLLEKVHGLIKQEEKTSSESPHKEALAQILAPLEEVLKIHGTDNQAVVPHFMRALKEAEAEAKRQGIPDEVFTKAHDVEMAGVWLNAAKVALQANNLFSAQLRAQQALRYNPKDAEALSLLNEINSKSKPMQLKPGEERSYHYDIQKEPIQIGPNLWVCKVENLEHLAGRVNKDVGYVIVDTSRFLREGDEGSKAGFKGLRDGESVIIAEEMLERFDRASVGNANEYEVSRNGDQITIRRKGEPPQDESSSSNKPDSSRRTPLPQGPIESSPDEGNVAVLDPKVKTDNQSRFKTLINLARRASSSGNNFLAQVYMQEIKSLDPNNIKLKDLDDRINERCKPIEFSLSSKIKNLPLNKPVQIGPKLWVCNASHLPNDLREKLGLLDYNGCLILDVSLMFTSESNGITKLDLNNTVAIADLINESVNGKSNSSAKDISVLVHKEQGEEDSYKVIIAKKEETTQKTQPKETPSEIDLNDEAPETATDNEKITNIVRHNKTLLELKKYSRIQIGVSDLKGKDFQITVEDKGNRKIETKIILSKEIASALCTPQNTKAYVEALTNLDLALKRALEDVSLVSTEYQEFRHSTTTGLINARKQLINMLQELNDVEVPDETLKELREKRALEREHNGDDGITHLQADKKHLLDQLEKVNKELERRALETLNNTKEYKEAVRAGNLNLKVVKRKDLQNGKEAMTISRQNPPQTKTSTIYLNEDIVFALANGNIEGNEDTYNHAFQVAREELVHAKQKITNPNGMTKEEYLIRRTLSEIEARKEIATGTNYADLDLAIKQINRCLELKDYNTARKIAGLHGIGEAYFNQFASDYKANTKSDRKYLIESYYSNSVRDSNDPIVQHVRSAFSIATTPLNQTVQKDWVDRELSKYDLEFIFPDEADRSAFRYSGFSNREHSGGFETGEARIYDDNIGKIEVTHYASDGRRIKLYTYEGGYKVVDSNELTQVTKERINLIQRIWENWDKAFLAPKGGDRNESLAKFQREITDKYGIKIVNAENSTKWEVEVMSDCLKLLPEHLLEDLRHTLRGGIHLGFTGDMNPGQVLGGIEGGGYYHNTGEMKLEPVGYAQARHYIDGVIHELGHPLEKNHFEDVPTADGGYDDSQFMKIYFKCERDMHCLPAVGYDGFYRKEYMRDHKQEFFAENFMHYILHGESFSKGFSDIPGLVKDHELWKEVYEYYKQNVFKGSEYRVSDGKIIRIN